MAYLTWIAYIMNWKKIILCSSSNFRLSTYAAVVRPTSQIFLTNYILCFFAAIRGYALSYLSSCAGRIRFLLGTPGMVALDLDASLKGLFQKIVLHLEGIPKPHGENISAITCNLSVSYLEKTLPTLFPYTL